MSGSFYFGNLALAISICCSRDDDIFLLLDADELPTVEALMFLKLFDGWTEPVKFGFRWTVFGFYWLKAEEPGMLDKVPFLGSLINSQKAEKLLTLYVACTVGMLRQGWKRDQS